MKKIICLISFFLSLAAARAQTLSIFDVDTSSFPVMKAKLYALDAEGKQVTNLNASDLSLSENGLPREILSISCPPVKPSERISSTIVIDVSGSMYGHPLDVAKTVAKTWVNALPLGQSDCAVVSFNGGNYFNQDFTTNRNKLLSAVDGLTSDDGTDYNAAMINPVAGGILTAKTAKYRKVIVFITDGMPNEPPNESLIISEALANGIMIHCITIGLPAHSSMRHFAEQTNGMLFENVSNEEEAKSIAQMLLGRSVYGFKPCEIQWKSELPCQQRFIDVTLNWNSLSATAKYFIPEIGVTKLVLTPISVRFINKPIGKKADMTVSITALHADFNISGFISSDPRFTITPSNLTIPEGETKEIILSFTPIDSSACYTYIDIQNNKCPMRYYAEGVYPNQRYNFSNLKLTFPNGGEEFQVGTDTLITWEGVLPNDTVKLEYSYDDGTTWNLITEEASGLKYVWKNILRPTSKQCLVRVIQKNSLYELGVNVEWEKVYGGTSIDNPKQVIETKNGYMVVGTTWSRDGDVDKLNGPSDIWALNLNKRGEVIWKKTFGGSAWECAYSVKEMEDGGFIIGAITTSDDTIPSKDDNSTDYWIIRLDLNGNILWSKCLGGIQLDELYFIEKTNDGGILAVGRSRSIDGDITFNHGLSDAWIVKLDFDGKIEWQQSFGGSREDCAYAVALTADNCFVIAGYSDSKDNDVPKNQGYSDCWVAKINLDGKLLWSKTFGGPKIDVLCSIRETQEHGFVVSGYSKSNENDIKNNHGFNDALVAKLNGNGELLWIKLLGGSLDDDANSIIETRDGNFLYVGGSKSEDGDVIPTPLDKYVVIHSWLVKLDNIGHIIWSRVSNKYYSDEAIFIQQTDDNGFITVEEINHTWNYIPDILVKKYSPEQIPQTDVSDSLFAIVSPTVTASNIDMGQVVLGSYKDSVITAFIKNTSKYDCLIKDIKSASSDFYVISNPTFTLKGNTEQAIEIHFKPSALGKIYSSITIVTQDTSFSQSIEGEGVQPTVQLNTALIDFGKVNVKELKDTVVVLLKNISGGSIDISDVKLLGPDKKQFEILEGGGAFTLGGGLSRELKIRFKPVYIGRTSCMLGFFHNGINSPAKAQLYGQGVGGLITVSDDSAYAGDKVSIDLTLRRLAPSALQNVASSFKAKLKYLAAPLSLLNPALKIGETPDSTIIEVKGTIGADSVLYTIDFIANDTPKDFTTIDLEEIKWYDAGGNEIEYEAETLNGSFKLLRYSGKATIFCTKDSAAVGEKVTLKLKSSGIDPHSFKQIAPKFRAELRYQKTLLAPVDKAAPISYEADSAYIVIASAVGESDELAAIDFIAGLGSVDSTSMDIADFKWINAAGEEIDYDTETESGAFKLLGVCREGGARLFNPTAKAGIEGLAPNPAKEEINVTVNQTESGDAYLIVYNVLGNEVARERMTDKAPGRKEIKLNISRRAPGVYYIKYQSPTATEVKRFIVE